MDAGTLIGDALILLVAAVLLHGLWYLSIAVLLWAPPALFAIVAGWNAYQLSSNITLSLAVSVVSQRIALISTRKAFNAIHRTLLRRLGA